MTRDEVICHLKALAANEVQPANLRLGLCYELFHVCKLPRPVRIVAKAAKTWEHFSGRGAYPVPDPLYKDKLTYGYYTTLDIWSPNHPYGAMRRDLCRHVAEYIEANPEIEV